MVIIMQRDASYMNGSKVHLHDEYDGRGHLSYSSNKDDSLSEVAKEVLKHLSKHIADYSNLNRSSAVVQRAKLNHFMHSVLIPLLIIMLLLRRYKGLFMKKKPRNPSDENNRYILGCVYKGIPVYYERIYDQIEEEMPEEEIIEDDVFEDKFQKEDNCKKTFKDKNIDDSSNKSPLISQDADSDVISLQVSLNSLIEDLQNKVFKSPSEVTAAVEETLNLYDYLKIFGRITTTKKAIKKLGKNAKVLIFYKNNNKYEILKKTINNVSNYIALLQNSQELWLSKAYKKSNQVKRCKRNLKILKQKNEKLAKIMDRKIASIIKLHKDSLSAEINAAFDAEIRRALYIWQKTLDYKENLCKLDKCTIEEEEKTLLESLYKLEKILITGADFMNV